VGAPVGPRALELVGDAPVGGPREALLRERGPRAVPTQPFERGAIVRSDNDARVQRQTFAPRAEPLDAADGRTSLCRRAPGGSCVGLDLCEHVGTRVLVDAIGVRVQGVPPRDPAQEAIEDREHVGVGRDGQELEA
jgi:hypothetical protein